MRMTVSLIAVVLCAAGSFAVEPVESDFFTDTIHLVTTNVNLVTDYGASGSDSNSDSVALQTAIDDLTSLPNGGKITIPAGTFYLSGIVLKSNVHIEVDAGATIIPPVRETMFRLGTDADVLSPIRNVSIRGNGGSYTIDISGIAPEANMNPLNCSSVDNFLVADMHVIDNWTDISCVTLNSSESGGNYNMPSNGVVKNITATGMHYGYGIMQMKCGRNILFKNLGGEGGATLRLESGGGIYTAPTHLVMDQIWARDISCTNGRCAVMISPHTRPNGYINVDRAFGDGCGFAATISGGYVAKDETDLVVGTGLPPTPGTFDTNSVVSNIHAVYGENAQFKSKHFKYIPCEILDQIVPLRGPIYNGASAACTLYTSEGTDAGDYRVALSNCTHSGFLYQSKPVITGADEFSCTLPVTGISVTPETTDVVVSNTAQLTVVFEPWLASNKKITWSTDASAVATVDSDGVVTAHAAGRAVITAVSNDGGYTDDSTVKGIQWTELLVEDFESGWTHWVSGGIHALLTTNVDAVIDTQAARLQDDDPTSYIQLASPLDLSGYSEVRIEFSFITSKLDAADGEGFQLQYRDHDGASWETVKTYGVGTDFSNGERENPVVTVKSSEVAFSPNAFFRIAMVVTGTTTKWESAVIDNIRIYAREVNVAWDSFVDTHRLTGIKTNHADSDGQSDWSEYLFGGDPTNAAVLGVTPVYDAGTSNYVFSLVGDSSLIAHVLTNSDLVAGSWGTNASVSMTATNGLMNLYTNAVGSPERCLFMKLLVE